MDDRERRERAKLVAQWRASGLSARAFAEGRGLKASQLYSWARTRGVSNRGGVAAFAEVRVLERAVSTELVTAEPSAPIEVVMGGITVRVRTGIDLELLAAVISVVSRC